MVSSLGAISGIILAGPRVYFAMAADRLLFAWMVAVHPTYRTPHRAIAAQAVWSSVLVLTGTNATIVSRVMMREYWLMPLVGFLFEGGQGYGASAVARGILEASGGGGPSASGRKWGRSEW